jgi:hypothetical protein
VLQDRGRNGVPLRFGGTTSEGRLQVTLTLAAPLGPGESVRLEFDGAPIGAMGGGTTPSVAQEGLPEGTHVHGAQGSAASGATARLDLNGALPGTDSALGTR